MKGERAEIFEDDLGDDFWDQVIEVTELAGSAAAKPSSNPSQPHHHPLSPTSSSTSYVPQPPQQQRPLHSVAASSYNAICYSPPRELSQRTADFDSFHHTLTGPAKCNFSVAAPSFRWPDTEKDLEIERLKRELARASKQLAHLEKESLELKKERNKKEEQLKLVSSKIEEENACVNCSKSINKEYGTLALDHHGIPQNFQDRVSSRDQIAEATYKATGVQTDIASHQEAGGFVNDDLPACFELSQKLLSVWGSPSDKNLGLNVISELLVGCQRDFLILFGCMSMNIPSKITMELLIDRSSSGLALCYLKDCFNTPEAAKVSYLYCVLTKIADGTNLLETVIEPLLDLCNLKKIIIVHSSLHILHTFLKLLMELEKNPRRRDNVIIEGFCLGNDIQDPYKLEGAISGKSFHMSGDEKRFSDVEMLSKKGCWNHQNALLPHVDWVSLFEIMHQIAMEITEESVRVEAVSIMNVILLRSNAYDERERFNQKMVFETISQLLKKDVGLHVKKHALRLLYLVLNCPKLLASFCIGCKEREETSTIDDKTPASDFHNLNFILQGLADCVASHGSGLQELKLRRNAILVLAFLASSGKAGFEILVGHRLAEGGNYLMLILQVLVSETDLEAGSCEELAEICRERTFLIREILILLNRLVSSPSYAATVLRCLTNTRDMASLTIDVANRMSWKGRKNEQQDSMAKHIRETEIIDLARQFKKRVYRYLGNDMS